MTAAITRRSPATLVALGAALVGLGASIYLTIEHFSSSITLACPENGAINCVKVTTSSWSKFLGIPVAVLGLVYFVAMAALCLPAAWRSAQLDVVRVIGAVLGVVSVIYLVWAELFRINAICLWCTVVHVCTLVLFGAVMWAVTDR